MNQELKIDIEINVSWWFSRLALPVLSFMAATLGHLGARPIGFFRWILRMAILKGVRLKAINIK